MSSESIKQRIVSRLIDEIGALDGKNLELMGHGLVELLENRRLVHHGINKNHQFVGYTVDSFSDDSTIVAQYSTEQGYFQNAGNASDPIFKKIEKDIENALTHRAPTGVTKIYLLSNQEEPPSFRAIFNRTSWTEQLGDALVILDARELGKLIYDLSVERPDAATFFRQFLPEFDEALDRFEYFGRLPAQCENYYSNEAALAALRDHFDSGERIAVLHGVSGAGKTQVAIDFVQKEQSNYDNYVWISGEDWPPSTPLSSVSRKRGGRPLNVVGNFNTLKTILVVDRFDRVIDPAAFSELQPGFDKGGVVVVTSQVAVLGARSTVPIPPLTREVAMLVLGEDPNTPTESAEQLVAACRGLPIVLATARNLIESEDIPRQEFYQELLAAPEALSGDDSVSILNRILNKLSKPTLEALQKIANTGLLVHDARFIEYFVGHLAKQELQKVAILSPAGPPGVLQVHELIARAVRTQDSSLELVRAVESYLEKLQGEMTPSALRQIHLARNLLLDEHDRRGNREADWIVYALLQLAEIKERVYVAYESRPIEPTGTLAALMSNIDAREQFAYSLPQEERVGYYRVRADEYRAALEKAEGRKQAELLHHLGKTYRRCGDVDAALATFQKLLDIEPMWHATLGQLAHLGAQSNATAPAKQAGEQALNQLLHQMFESASAVPLRVAMAALSHLRSYPSIVAQVNSDAGRVRELGWIISHAALEGLDQFYDAFYAFTSKFGYEHPNISLKLVRAAGEMFEVSPGSIGKRHLLSVGEALANVAQNARRTDDETMAKRLSGLSVVYAEALLAYGVSDTFTVRGIAKIFTVAGYPERALDVIGAVDAKRLDHWLLYRRAEAELALKMPEALATAQAALEGAQADPGAKSNLAAYFDIVSRCLAAAGDTAGALENVRLALAHCSAGRFQRELVGRLALLEAQRT